MARCSAFCGVRVAFALAAGMSGTTTRSFAQIFEAEFDYVIRSLRRLGVYPGDLEDVAQEVFLTVHDKFESYDPAKALRPWLFAFCVRKASNYRRLARHRVSDDERAMERAADRHTPYDAMHANQRRELVVRALDELSLDKKTVLIMHDLDGQSAPEIAEVLEIPLNTVYSRLRLARGAFRKAAESVRAQGVAA